MTECTFCGAHTEPEEFGVCQGCYEWEADAYHDARKTRLPDTPPLGVLGSVLLGGIVGLALIGKALERLPDPRAALALARALRFRRLI